MLNGLEYGRDVGRKHTQHIGKKGACALLVCTHRCHAGALQAVALFYEHHARCDGGGVIAFGVSREPFHGLLECCVGFFVAVFFHGCCCNPEVTCVDGELCMEGCAVHGVELRREQSCIPCFDGIWDGCVDGDPGRSFFVCEGCGNQERCAQSW